MITRIRMGIATESALTEKICWAFIKSRRYIARISDQRKTWQLAYVVVRVRDCIRYKKNRLGTIAKTVLRL